MRKGKHQGGGGQRRFLKPSDLLQLRREKRPCTVTFGSRDLSGIITETPLLTPSQSKSFCPQNPTEGRASGTGSRLQQTRPTLGISTSEEQRERHFRPHSRPDRERRGKQKARCLCVTSGESSGDNGNMALNGAGEDMDCGGLWLRGSGGTLLQQDLPAPCASLPPEVDDFSWEPPTEAETKVLQARRERQDRISRLMGDYLLRGYRMLGETCADCGVRR